MKKNTNWSKATTNLFEAIKSLLSALQAGKIAHLEIMKNEDVAYPIKVKNPETLKMENWTMMFGLPKQNDQVDFWNETERYLVQECYHTYTTPEAIRLFEEEGLITEDLLKSGGAEYMIPFDIAREIRLAQDGYDLATNVWARGTHYCIKDDVERWVLDPSVKWVFVVVIEEDQTLKKFKERN